MHLWCFGLLQVPEFQAFGCKVQAWRDILYGHQQPLVVSRLPAWRSILRGWRRPASRHDTVPFITHVFSIMRPPLLQVSWESRMMTNEATVVTLDKGSLLQPLTLSLQAGHCSIQHCIDSWHAQAHLHALTRAADYLLLHIARYEGDTVLNSHSLAFPALVALPVFGKGLRCFRATYRIAGIISHSGIRPGEGQYTAVLCSGTGAARESCWVVRDGRPAEHRDSLPLHVHRQCYVLALIRSRLLQ